MSTDIKNIKDPKTASNARRSFLGKIAYAAPVLIVLGGLKANATPTPPPPGASGLTG